MILMVLAQVGPLTAVTEALAAAAGIAVTAVILAVDVVLFGRSSELALQAGGLFAIFAGVVAGLILLERAGRRRDRNQ